MDANVSAAVQSDSGLWVWVNSKISDIICQCSWTALTYLEHLSLLFLLNSWKLKSLFLELSVVSDHILFSEFCRCSPPLSFFCFPSTLSLTHISLFFSLLGFHLFPFFTASQSMDVDSYEVWVGLVLYSFSLQSMSLPESWQDERTIFPLFVCSSAHHFLALSTLSTFPTSFSSSIIILWIFILPPPFSSLSLLPLS